MAKSQQIRVGTKGRAVTGSDLTFAPDPLIRSMVIRFDEDENLVAELVVFLGAVEGRFLCRVDDASCALYGLPQGTELWVDVDCYLARAEDADKGDFINRRPDVGIRLGGSDLLLPWSDFRMECEGNESIAFALTLQDRSEFDSHEGLAMGEEIRAYLGAEDHSGAHEISWSEVYTRNPESKP